MNQQKRDSQTYRRGATIFLIALVALLVIVASAQSQRVKSSGDGTTTTVTCGSGMAPCPNPIIVGRVYNDSSTNPLDWSCQKLYTQIGTIYNDIGQLGDVYSRADGQQGQMLEAAYYGDGCR